jgi:hypothetical protein
MQVNAQEEQKGLPAIPTRGMFQAHNYQAGGIVGYAGLEGSVVEEDPLSSYITREPQEARPDFPTSVRQAQALMAPHLQQSEAEKNYASMLKAPPADENKMMWLSLLRGGLKTLGGSSPYAGVNLGQGLGEAAQSYEEGLKEQQKQKLAYAKEMADQAKGQRQEGLAALTLGQKIYSDATTLQAALARAAKEGDMNSYARTYAIAARERGDTRSDIQLLHEGAQEYVKSKGALDTKLIAANAATTGATAATQQVVVSGQRAATEEEIRKADLERKKTDAEAERQRKRDEAEAKRADTEAERQRKREEAADKTATAAAERQRKIDEAEAKRADTKAEHERKKDEDAAKNRREALKNVNDRIADPSRELRRRLRTEGEAAVRADLLKRELETLGVGTPQSTPTFPTVRPQSTTGLPPGFRPSINPAPPAGFQIVPR